MKFPTTAHFYLNKDSSLYGRGKFIRRLPDIESVEVELMGDIKNMKKSDRAVIPMEEIVEFA